MNNIFTCASFFLILLSFSLHFFAGLREPQKLGMLYCHTVFSLKKTLECVCERLLHCRLIFGITWTPNKSFV